MTDKTYLELQGKYSKREIADGYIFPAKLSKKQRQEEGVALSAVLSGRRVAMSEGARLKARLLQLHFQMEDYLKDTHFDKNRTFSFFLKSYIQSLEIKQSQLAREIAIKPSVLSQYINSHRTPPDNVMIRLEIHSGNIIPAANWYLLLEKEKVYALKTNKILRAKQRPFVKKLSVSHKQAS